MNLIKLGIFAGPNLGYFCSRITATSTHKILRAKIPLFIKKNCSPYIYTSFRLYARYIHVIDFWLKNWENSMPFDPYSTLEALNVHLLGLRPPWLWPVKSPKSKWVASPKTWIRPWFGYCENQNILLKTSVFLLEAGCGFLNINVDLLRPITVINVMFQ